jgi:hypothetical protein
MQYIVWTMTEDEEILYIGNVEWDSMHVVWTPNSEDAGIFYEEEVEALEELYDYLEAEEV